MPSFSPHPLSVLQKLWTLRVSFYLQINTVHCGFYLVPSHQMNEEHVEIPLTLWEETRLPSLLSDQNCWSVKQWVCIPLPKPWIHIKSTYQKKLVLWKSRQKLGNSMFTTSLCSTTFEITSLGICVFLWKSLRAMDKGLYPHHIT